MKESKLYKSLLATIVVVALGAPAIASADATSELQGKSVKVSYADLNMGKQEGAKTLYRRLQQCYNDALSEAVEELDNELLTKIHNS
jgi:hypothetical protein